MEDDTPPHVAVKIGDKDIVDIILNCLLSLLEFYYSFAIPFTAIKASILCNMVLYVAKSICCVSQFAFQCKKSQVVSLLTSDSLGMV